MKITTVTLLLILFVIAPSGGMFAQQEFLDITFGAAGKQILELPALDELHDILIQPDGKILAAGTSLEGETFRSSLVRYLPDGSLDPGFGLNGKNHLLSIDALYSADVLALQSNGKILALQRSNRLIRYQLDGYPDPTFPSPLELNIQHYYNHLAIGPDDKILLSGRSFDNFKGFLITRLLPYGAKDPAFGFDGTVSLDFGPGSESATGVAVQPDGKIVACGQYSNPSPGIPDLIVVRLNANGTPDNSFGANGTIVEIAGASSQLTPFALMLQSDGKIVVGVTSWDFTSLFRFNPDGNRDSTFGINGEARTDSYYYAFDFTQAPDGSFYVYCRGSAAGNAILKFTPAGLLDSSFAGTGVLHTGMAFYKIAVQSNGGLVAAGTLADDFVLTRYQPEGAVDATFNGGEMVRTGIGQSGGVFGALAVQPDGRIVAAGSDLGYLPVCARFEAGGLPDADFISREKFLSPYNGAIDAIGLQSDGKILTGGQYSTGEGTEGLLYRLLPDGTLDNSFEGYAGSVRSLALQPDDKILTAGVDYDDLGHFGSHLVRLEADGSPDPGFGNDGRVTTNPCRCDRMALQADGNILVAGIIYGFPAINVAYRYRSDGSPDSTFGTNGMIQAPAFGFLNPLPGGKFLLSGNTADGFELYRFLPDGAPDAGFGIAGKKVLTFNNGEIIHAMEIQPNGKILLAGETTGDQGDADYLLARLLPDGSPDSTAGHAGFVTTNFDGVFADDHAYALAVQPDGKIVLAGSSYIFSDTSAYTAFSLARYRADLTVETKEVYGGPRIQSLVLTPNPAEDFLQIQINDPEYWDVSLYDLQGRQMCRQTVSGSQKIWVKDWPAGVYALRAMAGGRVFSGKIVKE